MNSLEPITSLDAFLAETFSTLDAERIRQALATTGHSIDIIIAELGLLKEHELAEKLAAFFDMPLVHKDDIHIDNDAVEKIGIDFFKNSACLPIVQSPSNQTAFCISNPFNNEIAKLIEYAVAYQPEFIIASRSDIKSALQNYHIVSEPKTEPLNNNGVLSEVDLARLQSIANEAPIIKLINELLQTAFDDSATDIHIEPQPNTIKIRMRVDGMLQDFNSVALNLLPGIATRIKILSRLNISERRLPQDGQMQAAVRGANIDYRVSIVPSVNGETIVLRVLDRSKVQLDLKSLGYDNAALETMRALSKLDSGIVLLTGPTGSGKTTSLYALLNEIHECPVKIFTVEDPVEYPFDGIVQLQVDTMIDLTFAKALRSVLRQDPDVILVGEIRDKETAEIAMQAALTGHLVLSTLHTNSAAGTITRLRDMGIDDYLISATLNASIAQRLVRKLCTTCHGDGCDKCKNTGFKGRIAVHEIVPFNDTLRQAIAAKKSEQDIVQIIEKDGIESIQACAKKLVQRDVTNLAEITRVLGSME